MEGPRPGGTALLITVSPEPGKYELSAAGIYIYPIITEDVRTSLEGCHRTAERQEA